MTGSGDVIHCFVVDINRFFLCSRNSFSIAIRHIPWRFNSYFSLFSDGHLQRQNAKRTTYVSQKVSALPLIAKLNHGKPDETWIPVPNMEKIRDDK